MSMSILRESSEIKAREKLRAEGWMRIEKQKLQWRFWELSSLIGLREKERRLKKRIRIRRKTEQQKGKRESIPFCMKYKTRETGTDSRPTPMRSFSASIMSSPSSSRFKSRGNSAAWHRSFSSRTTDQQPPLATGPRASPRRPYTPTPPGHGPPCAHGSHPPQFFAPPAPGPGHQLPPPTQFHGRGPPYTAVPPPYWQQRPQSEMYGPGPQRPMRAPNQNQNQMNQQPLLAFYKREWRFSPTRVPPQSERFQILSYNILADYLATEHYYKLYRHVQLHYLNWDWRKNKLLFEFQLWSPDILCLQEVDRFPDLQTEMERRGYNGIYKMRTGNAIDGCAIFWRTNRFKLMHHESIQFNEIELRDNVAQICVLESTLHKTPENGLSSLPSSNRVVVCNIHVLFNPKRGEIKLGQVRTLIDRTNKISRRWNDAPVILCGDFNSTPMSPLYKFISGQKLDISGLARNQISGQDLNDARPNFSRFISSNRTSQETGTEISNINLTEKAQLNEQINDPTNENTKLEAKLKDGIEKKDLPPSTDSNASQDLQENNEVTKPSNSDDSLQFSDSSLEESKLPSSNDMELGFEQSNQSESLGDSNIMKGDLVINGPVDCSSEPNLSLENSESNNLREIDESSVKLDFGEISRFGLSENESDIFKDDFVINETDEEFLKELHGSDEEGSFSGNNNVSIDEFNNNNDDGYYIYDPYKWAPHEIKAASGSEECTILEHSLKLRSVYTDVEDCAGTKDSNKEPEVTSYHQNFMGTVDYIWSSEGLKTVKVLDTIPKHILKQTRGFPTKKWGSDHIALVCQLAFVHKASDN
ncbi:hypothetical protein LUZ60_008289 [Juncus effusus]|nr:hypothetical protein LUZ60_008289 [Juncus effusus]